MGTSLKGAELLAGLTWTDVLTQALGLVALTFFVASFQIKDTRKTQLLFIPGSIAYGLQYMMLGSFSSGVILLSSAVRDGAGVYASSRVLKFFVILHLTVAFFSLAFLGKTWVEVLVLVSAILSSMATLCRNNFERFRFFIIGRQCAMFLFNIWIGSIGGIVHLSITLGSNLVGLWRYKQNDKSANRTGHKSRKRD